MTIALYYWRGANYERRLADIDTRLQLMGTQPVTSSPSWIRSGWCSIDGACGPASRCEFPAYTTYAERLCSRPSVQRALSIEDISVW